MKVCRLCLKEDKLVKKSHIIPKFLYKGLGLFNDKHKLNVYNKIDSELEFILKHPSDGDYESDLLCSKCENLISGKYETYASKVILGGLEKKQRIEIINYIKEDGLTFTKVSNLDCNKFKIFALSILWRASISTRPVFKSVNLGESNEERLREIILNNKTLNNDEFPIFLSTYLNDSTLSKDLIVQPQKKKTHDGHIFYRFIIGGIVYHFFIDSCSEKILSQTIKPSDEMIIFHIPIGKGMEFIGKSTKLDNSL